ncbi:Multifunctional CCA protein [Posidoniimonas polymericola]|uniref:Multifunctional CCA protein n=1 Tax=Posidoniimonas polymericola TaxID=2528002 RepID=A0A5C5YPP9_9BACT|nr:tRNA adenylyltransferase [Posidoniimonas polymericola]TWT76904.1 Multifunctional CCA protein [Posidoniimonas polymericola]
MRNSKLRRQIAWEAARLMYDRQESEYYRAKMKAARQLTKGWVKPSDLPSNAEIRDQIQSFARLYEGDSRTENLRAMRLAALAMMRRLERWRPRLIGSVLTGHTREGSDIDLHLFADSVESVTHLLEQEGLTYAVEKKLVRKQGEEQVYTHVHVRSGFDFELTLYASDQAHYVFKSSITGKPIERASVPQLEQFLAQQYPGVDLEAEVADIEAEVDVYQLYESLLLPLENVKQNPDYHPEGDALYHSLQVFDHARDEHAYDQEFLAAALLHDVGKAIDPYDHVAAGLEALDGFVTERTAWLIEHHMLCHKLVDGTLGARAKRRLRDSEHYHDLIALGECDRAGRQPGAEAPELDEALDYLRELDEMFG